VSRRENLVLTSAYDASEGLVELARRNLALALPHQLTPDPTADGFDAVLADARTAEAALIFFVGLPQSDRRGAGAEALVALAQVLRRAGLPPGVVVMGNPYTLAHFPEAALFLWAASDARPHLEAVFAHLTGRIPAPGRLPITVPGLA